MLRRGSVAGTLSAAVVSCALALGALRPASAETVEEMQRWGEQLGAELSRYLPSTDLPGLTLEPTPLFSAFANETYDYKGAQSMVRKYPSYVVHRTWIFSDPELERQEAQLERDKNEQRESFDKALAEFERVHGAERKAAEEAYRAQQAKETQEYEARVKQFTAQFEELMKEGKYQAAAALGDKMAPPGEHVGAFVYPPLKALTDAYDREQKTLDERARALGSRRRTVDIYIYANRTPTATAPKFHPKPAGTLAGHPLWRQDEGEYNNPGQHFLDLAVALGPPDFRMPQVLIGHKELAVKVITVWVFLQSINSVVREDEETMRKVLETINYDGLAKLITP